MCPPPAELHTAKSRAEEEEEEAGEGLRKKRRSGEGLRRKRTRQEKG